MSKSKIEEAVDNLMKQDSTIPVDLEIDMDNSGINGAQLYKKALLKSIACVWGMNSEGSSYTEYIIPANKVKTEYIEGFLADLSLELPNSNNYPVNKKGSHYIINIDEERYFQFDLTLEFMMDYVKSMSSTREDAY